MPHQTPAAMPAGLAAIRSESDAPRRVAATVPALAGAGLKGEHVPAILSDADTDAATGSRSPVAFFEVHAENYMGAGGPPHAALEAVRERFPLSVHGVGLSIGASRPLDEAHLARLKGVVERYEPGLVSEHLAWSTHATGFMNDLLPMPYTEEVLGAVCAHVDRVQEALGRTILLENPSTYAAFDSSTMLETDFIRAIATRTGCGLLLDLNNVFVSATNQRYSPWQYLDAFPLEHVGELHLAGHAEDEDDHGRPLLIDAHDRPVSDPVWALYRYVVGKVGPRPTLVEWDNDVPDWSVLKREAALADDILTGRDGARAAPRAGAERHAVLA